MPESHDSLQRFRSALEGFQLARAGYEQEIEGVEACLGLLDGRILSILGTAQAGEGNPPPDTSPREAPGLGDGQPDGREWSWLQSVLAAAPSYVYIWCKDRAGNLLFANPAAAQTEGFQERLLNGAGQQHLDVLRSGHPSLGQVETLPFVNGPRWIRVNRHPVLDGQGQVNGVIAFGLDITDLRQAEASLGESEQRYRTLFETMTEALLLCEWKTGEAGEPEWLIQDANPAFEKAFGTPLPRIRFRRPAEVLPALSGYLQRAHGHRLDAEAVVLEDLCLRDPGLCFEARYFWPDASRLALVFNNVTERRKGEQRLLRMNEELEGLVQGRTRALEAAVVELQAEITVRKQAEQSLVRLAAAVEQSAEAVAILGLGKEVIFANPAFYQILGLPQGGPLDRDFPALLGAGEDAQLAHALDQALEGRAWKGRILVGGPADAQVQLEGSISPVRDPQGTLCTLVAVLRDVTREAQMDRHLRQVEKMDALGVMASGIAHDFNNILMAILTTTELIEWQLEEASPVHAKLKIICQAAHRAQELNRQILTFSRKADETRIPFDLSGVAREVATMLGSTLPAHTAFETDIASSIWITGDPGQFHQVLVNLIINACHAMEAQGGRLTVSLAEIELREGSDQRLPAGQGEGRFALLTVSDTGCGMSAVTQEKIFEPFFTTKPEGEGTGLGLSVVHGIVSKHGGTIQVSSEQGRGSRFQVFIPSTIRQAAAASEGSGEGPGGTEHILFVDDDDIVAALAKHGLQALGYQVTAKTSPWDALEVFQARPEKYDLLVTDLVMPDLSGGDLTRRLRQIRPDLPAILLTGAFVLPETLPGLSVNHDAILAKPLVTKELAHAIRRVLGSRERHVAGPETRAELAKGLEPPEDLRPVILLAEDSSVTRSLLRSWLTKGGFRIHEAKDGQEAWELFCAAEDPTVFSMLLTDLDMPRMNGLELVRKTRMRDPEIPILILTASEDMDSLREALHLQVNEFLIKPFDSKGLLEHVNRLVAKRRVGMEAHHHAETAQAVRRAQRSMEAVPEQDLPVYSICKPLTDAGGDVFRCLRRPDGSVVLVLADVAGHSVTSSYAVAAFLGMLSTFVQDWWGLAGLFHRLNQNIQTGPFPEHPIAVLAAHWEPNTGRLHVMNAGNPYGLWQRKGLGRTQAIPLKGTPLGLFDQPILKEKVLVLEPGDRVLFGTDGLYDMHSPDQGFFRDQMAGHWAQAAELPIDLALGALCAAAGNHGRGRFLDDVLVVGLEQPSWRQAPHELLCAFPAEPLAVERADQALAELLAGHPQWQDLDASARFDLFLAVHEALSNAIEHGSGFDAGKRVALACRLTDACAVVRVVDEGPGFDLAACRPPQVGDADRGRGVPILQAATKGLRMRGGELKFQFNLRRAVHDIHA